MTEDKTIREADTPFIANDGHRRFKETVEGKPVEGAQGKPDKAAEKAGYGQEK